MDPQSASGSKRGAVAREVAEVRRRLVACLPVGASTKKKTENLKEMKSTLKAVGKEWRMLFNEELVNLELDLCVRSRRVEWCFCGQVLRLRIFMFSIQGWRCRPVARFVDLVDRQNGSFCLSLNSGGTVQYKHMRSFCVSLVFTVM